MKSMHDVTLELAADEWIPMGPQDNRSRSQQKANKFIEDAPALDLLQRARYVLRIAPLPRDQLPHTGEALFSHGLLVQYLASDRAFVDKVCVVNLSDKIVKVHDGMKLTGASTSRPQTPPLEALSEASASSHTP